MGFEELPLVFFTVLTQMAIGLVLVSAVRQWAVVDGPGSRRQTEWLAALGLLGAGVVASFFHLGHPLGAVRMIVNAGTAWLSREILLVGMFGALLAVTLFGMYRQAVSGWQLKATALVGLLALFSMAMTYAPPSLPAIDNYLPVLFFGLTALILGPAIAVYFTPTQKQPLLTTILAVALVVGLVVYLVVPTIWLAGDRVMQLTGQQYLASPLYWLYILAGFVLPLGLLAWQKRIPLWLPALLLITEFVGRFIFFTHIVSSASNLGGLY